MVLPTGQEYEEDVLKPITQKLIRMGREAKAAEAERKGQLLREEGPRPGGWFETTGASHRKVIWTSQGPWIESAHEEQSICLLLAFTFIEHLWVFSQVVLNLHHVRNVLLSHR